MEPTTATLAMSAGSAIMGGMAAKKQANAEADAAKVNSYIARTRAKQADTDARTGLESELGTMRASLGANGQAPSVGSFEVMKELRTARDRERRVNVGNKNQEASDFNTAARNAQGRASMAMPMALMKAAPSMFDLYQGI